MNTRRRSKKLCESGALKSQGLLKMSDEKPTVKMVKMANLLAGFIRLEQRFVVYGDLNYADTSMSRSVLYCINVMESDIFELHSVKDDAEALIKSIDDFSHKLNGGFSTTLTQLTETKTHLEVIVKFAGELTFDEPKTRPKNMRARYIAAIVANCYYDKFGRWPITESNNPRNDFLECTDAICKVLDKKFLYGISGACDDFSKNPWVLWKHFPPLPLPFK